MKAIYPPGTQGVPFEEMIDPEKLGSHRVKRAAGTSMGDILISNCVLWNDEAGQGFEIGFELRIDSLRGVTIRDSDIIHVTKCRAFTIHNGDHAHIEDILIENVRVENTDRLIDFHVGLSIYSDDCPEPYRRSNPKRMVVPARHRPTLAKYPYQWFVPADSEIPFYHPSRGSVRNVRIKNVRVLNAPRTDSILHGYSKERGICDIVLEGMEINGHPVRTPEHARLKTHEAYGVEIR